MEIKSDFVTVAREHSEICKKQMQLMHSLKASIYKILENAGVFDGSSGSLLTVNISLEYNTKDADIITSVSDTVDEFANKLDFARMMDLCQQIYDITPKNTKDDIERLSIYLEQMKHIIQDDQNWVTTVQQICSSTDTDSQKVSKLSSLSF